MSIDEILADFSVARDYPMLAYEEAKKTTKQAIYKDLMELIGEVKHDKGFMRAAPEYGPDYSVGRPKCEAIDGYECTCGADIANSTRDKIREKIKAYCE